jgi:hypothetical protein
MEQAWLKKLEQNGVVEVDENDPKEIERQNILQ